MPVDIKDANVYNSHIHNILVPESADRRYELRRLGFAMATLRMVLIDRPSLQCNTSLFSYYLWESSSSGSFLGSGWQGLCDSQDRSSSVNRFFVYNLGHHHGHGRTSSIAVSKLVEQSIISWLLYRGPIFGKSVKS